MIKLMVALMNWWYRVTNQNRRVVDMALISGFTPREGMEPPARVDVYDSDFDKE